MTTHGECRPRTADDTGEQCRDRRYADRELHHLGQDGTEHRRLLAGNVVAMEDGYQMEVLSGRRSRDEVKARLHSYARAVTGCDVGLTPAP